jgi:membrane-bound serine protease (ClpP class)
VLNSVLNKKEIKTMKKLILLAVIFLITLSAQDKKVYHAYIEGDIDLGLAPYVKRVISEAETNLADAIIFEINTFGGRVDAATQIKDAILDSKVKTIAFIDKRAISAGALISLSCEQIIMVPGASIGASTVVDQSGQKQAEKYQSYMRSEMRATAEKTGRPTDVAEAMVDETVVIEGLVDSSKLVTLTSEEAVKWGIADTIISSFEKVLIANGLEDAEVINLDENWAESIVRFINNPIISSLLIMIGLLGLFTEIKTPGWGLPGTAALIALALFFGTGYILELASIIEIILFIAGVILVIIGIFVVPGFGIFEIAGILLMVAGLFLGLLADFPLVDSTMISMAIIQLALTFVATIFMVFLLSKFLPKSSSWNTLILKDNIITTSGYSSAPDFQEIFGMTGKCLTDLRPSGTAVINNKRYDVVTAGEFISHGVEIKVVKVDGAKIVVEAIENL